MNGPALSGPEMLADALMRVPMHLDLRRDDHRQEFSDLARSVAPFARSGSINVGEFMARFLARVENDPTGDAEVILREALTSSTSARGDYLQDDLEPNGENTPPASEADYGLSPADTAEDGWRPPDKYLQTKAAIRLTWFRDIALSRARRYLVKGLIPRIGLTVVWGEPKCGKSFWVFDVMMHVAREVNYRGRRVQGGAVVYCALEGQFGFSARTEAYRQLHKIGDNDNVPLVLMDEKLNLVRSHADLIAAIKGKLGDATPVAVVLDTLNRSLIGSESSDEDMSAYVTAADAIREAFQCAVVIVHHSGLDKTRPRGHTSLLGAVDAQISVKRDAAKNILIECEYMKDGEAGATEASRLQVVEVGEDKDGDIITSCVAVPTDAVPVATGRMVTGASKQALELLERAILEKGRDAPSGEAYPASVKVVSVSIWREYCYAGTVSASSTPDAKQKAFVRAVKALQDAKAIGIWNDLAWIARTSQT